MIKIGMLTIGSIDYNYMIIKWLVWKSSLVTDLVGEGSFSQVYRGFYQGSEVAVKQLRVPLSAQDKNYFTAEVMLDATEVSVYRKVCRGCPSISLIKCRYTPRNQSLTRITLFWYSSCSWGWFTVSINAIIYDQQRKDVFFPSISQVNLLKELRHPRVVLLMGVCTSSSKLPLMLLEFMAGGSLFHHLHDATKWVPVYMVL